MAEPQRGQMEPELRQVVPQLEQVETAPQHPDVACVPGQATLLPAKVVVAPFSALTCSNAQLDRGKRGSEKNSFYTGCYPCISPAGTRG